MFKYKFYKGGDTITLIYPEPSTWHTPRMLIIIKDSLIHGQIQKTEAASLWTRKRSNARNSTGRCETYPSKGRLAESGLSNRDLKKIILNDMVSSSYYMRRDNLYMCSIPETLQHLPWVNPCWGINKRQTITEGSVGE